MVVFEVLIDGIWLYVLHGKVDVSVSLGLFNTGYAVVVADVGKCVDEL